MNDDDLDEGIHEAVDELQRFTRVLAERGLNDPRLAAQLMLATRIDDLEMALAGFRDDVMLFLETGGLPLKVPSTEELLKHYNPEVLELIKHGDARMEVFKDRIVLSRGEKPKP
jgi:hypothetical protein